MDLLALSCFVGGVPELCCIYGLSDVLGHKDIVKHLFTLSRPTKDTAVIKHYTKNMLGSRFLIYHFV